MKVMRRINPRVKFYGKFVWVSDSHKAMLDITLDDREHSLEVCVDGIDLDFWMLNEGSPAVVEFVTNSLNNDVNTPDWAYED